MDPQRTKGQDNKVQNGSLHQKDTVHDNEFEPYLSGQSNQVSLFVSNVTFLHYVVLTEFCSPPLLCYVSHFIILNNKEALEIIERLLMKTGFALNESVSAVKLAFSLEAGTNRWPGWRATRILGGLGVGRSECTAWGGVEMQVVPGCSLMSYFCSGRLDLWSRRAATIWTLEPNPALDLSLNLTTD